MAEKRTLMLRVGVTRKYGAHEVYFEMAEQVDIENGEQRREAYLNLLAQVDDQIKHYEHFLLPTVKLPMGGSSAPASGNASTKEFKPDSISVEFKDNKRQVSLKGGEYQKFGVPLYKECDTVWPIETADFGTHDLRNSGLVAVVELVGGKPKRVLSLK